MALLLKLGVGEAQPDPQTQSPLVRLPLEIRREIYDYVYPEHLLHVKKGYFYGKRIWVHFWCIDLFDHRFGYTHLPCHQKEIGKKHMLGLPLTCRRLYSDTIQTIYKNHTFDLLNIAIRPLEWLEYTPKVHVDAVTSIRLTSCPLGDKEAYKEAWSRLASVPNLEKLFVLLNDCATDDAWESDALQEVTDPIKLVQQNSLQSFDLIFDIWGTWFSDDEDAYMKISYNRLQYDTFLIDRERFPPFKGVHPRCRLIGMNGTIRGRPIREDMPTMKELTNWFSWFSCNAAFGANEPEGYDYEAIGPIEAARLEVEANTTEEEREAKQAARSKVEDELEEQLERNNDPEAPEFVALNYELSMFGDGDEAGRVGSWTFPERPDWIPEGTTLDEPNDFGEHTYD